MLSISKILFIFAFVSVLCSAWSIETEEIRWKLMDTMVEKVPAHLEGKHNIKDGYIISPHHFDQGPRADASQEIKLIIRVIPKMTLDELNAHADSQNRGDLNHREIAMLTANHESSSAVYEYFANHGVEMKSASENDLSFVATSQVGNFENALNTKFYTYQNDKGFGAIYIRAPEYSLPEKIARHVRDIQNAVDFPSPLGMSRIPLVPEPMKYA